MHHLIFDPFFNEKPPKSELMEAGRAVGGRETTIKKETLVD